MKVIRKILFLSYLISKINWIALFRLLNSDSKYVVLVCSPYPKRIRGYLSGAILENDFALLNAMIQSNTAFRLVLGADKLLEVSEKTVIFNISDLFDVYSGLNYADSFFNFSKKLIANNNTLIPELSNSVFWENKIYMHQQFDKLGLPNPVTYCVDADTKPPKASELRFPVLLKPAHSSGSTGIIKINTEAEYNSVVSETTHAEYLIQYWIDMRRDLRLIYIGDELVLHYWRINNSAEWSPTSTGHGSSVDFESLPTQWMPFLFDQYKKLNIRTGAFDVTWLNDDLDTPPLILEVSPSYMPNPAPSEKWKNKSYSTFKKAIFGKDVYYKQYIDLVFELKTKLIKQYIN